MINPTEQQLFDEEKKHIGELLPHYNIGSVGGGDNLTNNPNREDIIKRMIETNRVRILKMTVEEKKRIWSRPMDKNPNWRGGVSIYHCVDCNVKVWYGSSRCMDCSKEGEKNPFYGKNHTDEYKKRSSLRMMGKLPTNTNPVIIDGVSYTSQADAARKLGVSTGTISNWVTGKFKRRQAS